MTGLELSPTTVEKAIVVLGARLAPDGSAPPVLRRRVACGVALWRSTPDAWLVMTGGQPVGTPASSPPEAAVMADLACALGVPVRALLIEPRARNTRENARFSVAALPLAVVEVTVVSDAWHLPRAGMLFRRAGAGRLRVRTTAAPLPEGGRGARWWWSAVREVAAFAADLFRR